MGSREDKKMSGIILDLPIELYNYIFQYLPALDVYIFIAPTCSLFQRLIYSGKLPCLTNLTLEPSHSFMKYPHSPVGFKGELTDEILITFSRTSGRFLKSISLKTTTNPNRTEMACRRNLTDKSIRIFLEQSVNLRKIELVCIRLRYFETLQKLRNLSMLETMIISYCSFAENKKGSVIPLPSLKKLKINDVEGNVGMHLDTENLEVLCIDNVEQLPNGADKERVFPTLTELYLVKCYKDDYREYDAHMISTRFPNLRILQLRKCHLGGRMKKPLERLVYLELAVRDGYEYLFSGEEKFFPDLRDLRIAHYSRYNDTIRFDKKLLASVPNLCPLLETFELRNVPNVSSEDILNFMKNLKGSIRRISFPNCRNVMDSSLLQSLSSSDSCPSLEEVELSWPGGGTAKETNESFRVREMISLITNKLALKLKRLVLRGFPPIYYPELQTYSQIQLIPKDLPLVYLQQPQQRYDKRTSFYNYGEEEEENNVILCGCGKEMERIQFFRKHQFVCPKGRKWKFEEQNKSLELDCKTCGLKNIKARNYEHHIILHEEHVCFNGGWICRCSQECNEYLLKKKDSSSTTIDQHYQNCDHMIVMCNACGNDITYSKYDDHIENECTGK